MSAFTASVLLLRSALLVVLTGTAAVGMCALSRDPLRVLAAPVLDSGVPGLAHVSFEQALTGGCALVLVVCAVWLVLAVGLAVVTEVARVVWLHREPSAGLEAMASRVCPMLIRTVVATALGALVTTTVTTVVVGPAQADRPGDGSRSSTSGSSELTGLALPDRMVASPAGSVVAPPAARRLPDAVVVRPGDSLWSIAADLLPQGAGDPRICRAWHRLYQANRDRIGADPDLIHPGIALVVPGPSAPRGGDHP